MRRTMSTALAVLGVAALGCVALALPALSASNKKVVLTAKLKGSEETPDPGDPNGKGNAEVTLNAKKGKVCFGLELDKLDPVTAGHIHKGAKGVAGEIKVPLFEDAQGLPADPGAAEGCVKNVKKKLIKKIGKRPENYYVNVHNAEYPAGAIRGQLKPAQ
jgi:hypothetical protein